MHGESNSVLIVGPRGAGKTMVRCAFWVRALVGSASNIQLFMSAAAEMCAQRSAAGQRGPEKPAAGSPER